MIAEIFDMWEWWHWAVLGGALLVLDVLALNVYYPLWFGIAAILTAAVLAVFPELPMWMQILMFCVLSALLLGLWLLFLRPHRWRKNREAAHRELPGQAGVVVHFNPTQHSGTLRLQKPVGGRDVWDFATAADLRAGDRVVIKQLGDNDMVELMPTQSDSAAA